MTGFVFQMGGILHGQDGLSHRYLVELIDQQDLHLSVIDIRIGGWPIASAIVSGIGSDDGGESAFDVLTFDGYLHRFRFVGQKVVDDTGVVAHGLRDEAVVYEAVIVGDVGVDAETRHIDEVTIIDLYDVRFMDPVIEFLHAIAAEIVPRTIGNEGEDIIGSDQIVEQKIDRTVASDRRDDVFAVFEAFKVLLDVLYRFALTDLIIPAERSGYAFKLFFDGIREDRCIS